MLAVGEMGSYLPIKGSFIHFAARWVDPALGFACGLFRPYLVGGATGKFLGWWNTLIYAAFACGGADILSLVAFEVSQPRKSMGIAAKRSFVATEELLWKDVCTHPYNL
ncbi:hypothetical protein QCA50_017031 [Cerrena zonata]|uniref:Amino acid permease/ SLC12A domain-containing protein n=1 Tax=Cerrena zonata TaxID=2478898 RepID=A0AAW0FFW5_9APHY